MSTPRDPGLDAFVRHAELRHEDIENANRYPFNLPAFKNLPRLYFHPEVTFFVGRAILDEHAALIRAAAGPAESTHRRPL